MRITGNSNVNSAITHIWLENFRNYRLLELDVGCKPVVLIGRNGSGKTNVLEAISLFSPGRGIRKSSLREMDNRASGNAAWTVAATLTKPDIEHQLATGRDGEASIDKRILKIDGTRERGQASLCRYLSVTWLTPQMDTLFLEGGSARRKLLDRLVYAFDPEHAERVSAYEQAMRERNRLLYDRNADPYWLSVLEQQMAQHAIAITIAREDTLARIREQMAIAKHPFAKASWYLVGTIEAWLGKGMSALECEANYAERLKALRAADASANRATEGAHRSRLEVIHSGKDMPAEQCSTGEQKSMLVSLLLNHASARASWCSEPPILLLDEVVAHLDVEHRKELFDAMLEGGMQTWMTGTEASDFQGLEQVAAWVQVDDGDAKRIA
ncbi:MAG: DNA replication/repair protein RecF [Alphaproteobacteria bacterium]|nr:DNA replication/repair protein RecF [Alphaproteobacteria bacterium]